MNIGIRLQKMTIKEKYLMIFCSFLMVRLGFVFLLKKYFPDLEAFPDTRRYEILSSQILEGNFNLDCGLFLVAPVYPYFLALTKLIFGEFWNLGASSIQIILSCLSGIYFYKFSKLIFDSEKVAILGTLGYCFYPFTMWYVHSISQETIYQTFLIFSLYHFVFGLKNQNGKHLIYSAILFSICFLTKSIILFYSPFLALLIYWYFDKNVKNKLKMVFTYTFICIIFTLPNGIYNLKTHGVYTFSSDGISFYFSYSNNEHTSKSVGLYKYAKGLNHFDYPFGKPFEMEQDVHTKKHSPKERNKAYLLEGWTWIRNYPKEWVLLSLTKLQRYLTPGFSFVYHPLKKWLPSFLIGLPVFIFGYLGLIKGIRTNFKTHGWMFFLFLSMLIFSIIFCHQGRFRIVTMEGFYLMYAAFGWVTFIDWLKKRQK